MVLITIEPQKIPENVKQSYRVRLAGRAIVNDLAGNIALLYVSQKKYHKLPGGGCERDERPKHAVTRECQEEIGCHIKLGKKIGDIVEYRSRFRLKQISTCYRATIVGEKGKPAFTKSERAQGFKIIWAPLNRAIQLLKHDRPKNYEGRFIQKRDSAFLKAYQNMYGKKIPKK